jgi:hypothetical protein
VKTHKERVEELNKYLSNLSEHHDMYVASPPFLTVYLGPLRMAVANELLFRYPISRGSEL